MEAIPTIVCDTLYAMGLHDQTPSWKIMDNKGRITVVLHWEREGAEFQAISGPSRQSSTSTIASGGPRLLGVRSLSQHGSSISSTPCLSRDNSRNSTGGPGKAAATIQHSMLVQTSFDSTMGHLPHSSGSHPRKDSKISDSMYIHLIEMIISLILYGVIVFNDIPRFSLSQVLDPISL